MVKSSFSPVLRSIAALLVACTLAALAEYKLDALVELANKRYGSKGATTVAQWLTLLDQARDLSETEKLLEVNDFFNRRIAFRDDKVVWDVPDYWATPLETMGHGQGDCEDFSIAKYVSLIKLGIPMEKLRLTYVKAELGLQRPQAHMILAYYSAPQNEPLILDNLSKDIRLASDRTDLRPVFSFNSAGLWVGSDLRPKTAKPETRLSRWRDVLLRMQLEQRP